MWRSCLRTCVVPRRAEIEDNIKDGVIESLKIPSAPLTTTNVYAEVDLEMKARALAQCEITGIRKNGRKNWQDNHDLMDFLRSLQKLDSDLPIGNGERRASRSQGTNSKQEGIFLFR